MVMIPPLWGLLIAFLFFLTGSWTNAGLYYLEHRSAWAATYCYTLATGAALIGFYIIFVKLGAILW